MNETYHKLIIEISSSINLKEFSTIKLFRSYLDYYFNKSTGKNISINSDDSIIFINNKKCVLTLTAFNFSNNNYDYVYIDFSFDNELKKVDLFFKISFTKFYSNFYNSNYIPIKIENKNETSINNIKLINNQNGILSDSLYIPGFININQQFIHKINYRNSNKKKKELIYGYNNLTLLKFNLINSSRVKE